jgi:hypothetical protein
MMITKQQIDDLYLRKDEITRQLRAELGLPSRHADSMPPDDETIAAASQKAFAELDLRKLKADPLLGRFIQQRQARGYKHLATGGVLASPIKTAWEAEGERLMYLLALGEPSAGFSHGFEHSPNGHITARLFAFYTMMMAVPYLWRGEILEKAESLPVPRHTIPENVLPYTRMYWSYEGCRDTYATNPDTGEHFEMEGDGLLVWYAPPGYIQAGTLGGSDKEGQPTVRLLQTAELRMGSTWPDDYSETEQSSLRPLLAKLSFLNSPYVSSERQRLPRPIRRALAKESAPNADPTIHVVKLREVSAPHGGAGGTGKEFHHQWWVRGHIRAQWFPSQKGHRLIWIQEYLKGPSGAPIIRKIYDVQQ